ncbi:Spy/CpxP family protein refolding chaperone [Photobacterium sp.]|uniref:Spy/CpxP family protein refolding chaperone n=1 Tax=Photobacterium sp. TaxID=660 RepID=UPI00299D4247|nr:Spy/CpxP family protein refolding chaperone [Photobacterium sp.]MDX1301490.1 Spy/CpxP family protein refolding chaperone [Photobacterium sp.]
MKYNRMLFIAVTAAIGLTTTLAYAAQDWQRGMTGMMGGPGMMAGGCMMGGGPGMMAKNHSMMQGRGTMAGSMGIATMQEQFNELESQLKLNEEQQVKWNEFEKVVEQQANSMLEHHQKMLDYFQSGQSLTLPERIDRHTQMMSERFTSMTAYSAALANVYQSLEPQQQKILDQNTFMGCF